MPRDEALRDKVWSPGGNWTIIDDTVGVLGIGSGNETINSKLGLVLDPNA